MNALSKKLRSQNGASLLYALLFLLFCVFVGGTVLAGAAANSYRITRMSQQQQQELNDRCAAQFVVDELGMGDESVSMTFKYETSQVTVTLDDSTPMTSLRRLAVEMTIKKHIEETKDKSAAVTIVTENFKDADGKDITKFWCNDTSAKVTLTASDSTVAGREINIGYLDGSGNYTFTADLGEDSIYSVQMKVSSEENGPNEYKVTLGSPEIIKGGA